MSDFKYSKDKIDKQIEELNLCTASMAGVYEDLKRLKPLIENFYDKYIFYLSYWESECAYHGWSWTKDDGRMRDMAIIPDGITRKFEEIYALILSGLGEKVE